MRILEIVISVVPSIAVLTLAWFVVRAVSVRVVWREHVARQTPDAGGSQAETIA